MNQMKNFDYDLGPKLGKVLSDEELSRLRDIDESGYLTITEGNSGLSFAPMEPQPLNLCFSDGSKDIGKFYHEDDQLCFDGALSESGHVFIDHVLNTYNSDQKKKVKEAFKEGAILALGWMIAEACVSLDNDEDIRNVDMSDILARATKDLEL